MTDIVDEEVSPWDLTATVRATDLESTRGGLGQVTGSSDEAGIGVEKSGLLECRTECGWV